MLANYSHQLKWEFVDELKNVTRTSKINQLFNAL